MDMIHNQNQKLIKIKHLPALSVMLEFGKCSFHNFPIMNNQNEINVLL